MIKRSLLSSLKTHLECPEISLIIGPRQAGKTTIMELLKEYLDKKGEKTLFLSLDFETDKKYFLSQRALINKIELEFGNQKGYIFIDEIQRKEDAGIFLKGLYDLHLPYKFIVSGSGSVELKEKIHESLVGRKRLFELNTISFKEFVNFKTNNRYENNLINFLQMESSQGKSFLMEYLNFGGYPRVVIDPLLTEKIRLIDEIYRSYIEKDIVYLLKIEKIEAFSSLMKILSSQIGQLINYSELSTSIGIAVQTIKNYIWYAQKTYTINKVTPYFTNVRKELSKSPIVYFYDLGLRNYALGLFGQVNTPNEFSFLFENFVFTLLKEHFQFSSTEIHYWRTKDKAEVDFVLCRGKNIVPVEVKFKEFKTPKIERSLHNFIAAYQPAKTFIINLNLDKQIKINNTQIIFLPFYRLLDKNLFT
ncbi:hypothetical protein MNBD_UNCLBAC01-815 [hydrothermal vent metagenome]|uniref:ATPase n=1 Tax=hydrothermal vent metagenome TaxID=652676 RepID=A0A3B1DME2_9ZZZZ